MVLAVGIGDDAAPRVARDGVGVHFRHHQRHVRLHAEVAGVVDHDAAGGGGARSVDGGDGGAGAEQADVPAGKFERLQVLHGQHALITKADLLAGGARAGEGHDIRDREAAFEQRLDHLPADSTGGTHDRNFVTH